MNPSQPGADPLDQLIVQIGELVQMAKKCLDLPPTTVIPVDVRQKIAELERDVRIFIQINNEVISRHTPASQNPKGMLEEVPNLNKHDTRLFNKLESFKNEISGLQKAIEEQMKAEGATDKMIEEEKCKEKPLSKEPKVGKENRKGKFRPLGGSKNWGRI